MIKDAVFGGILTIATVLAVIASPANAQQYYNNGGYGYGMMGPGYMGCSGCGPGMMGPGYGPQQSNFNLSTNDVKSS
jgi:hypothetical protein